MVLLTVFHIKYEHKYTTYDKYFRLTFLVIVLYLSLESPMKTVVLIGGIGEVTPHENRIE